MMAPSAISVPVAPSQPEAEAHVGNTGMLDPIFYQQFVSLTQFVWSTTQPPGTLLWSTAISPKKSTRNLKHISQMYNLWVGGFDYQLKVGGTGFHAGALAIVRLPPNIAPETLVTPADFSVFEYTIMDPKTLEAMAKNVCDQRRNFYHNMNEPENSVDAIGGYIGVYVWLQLNTSSTGTSQIDVSVATRCAPDFAFLQMRNIVDSGPTVDDGVKYAALFENKTLHINPYTGVPVTNLIINASTKTKIENINSMTDVNTGKLVFASEYALYNRYVGSLGYRFPFKVTAHGSDGHVTGQFLNNSLALPFGPAVRFNSVSGDYSKTYYAATAHSYVSKVSNAIKIPFSNGVDLTNPQSLNSTAFRITFYTNVLAKFPIGETIDIFWNPPNFFFQETTLNSWSPPVAESIVEFSCTTATTIFQDAELALGPFTVKAATTLAIAGNFASRTFARDLGFATLLLLVDKEFNAPLTFLKLYNQGVFTAQLRTGDTTFAFDNVTLKYVGVIRETDPIPGNTLDMGRALELYETRQLNKEMRASLAMSKLARGPPTAYNTRV